MLSYITQKKTTPPENKPFISEKLIPYKDYATLAHNLQEAKDQIKELVAKLAEKEKSQEALHEKINSLTKELEQEKSGLAEQQKTYREEEDSLLTEIASLKATLGVKEDLYKKLRIEIFQLQKEQQTQAALQAQNLHLESMISKKEDEHTALRSKISELEIAKQQIEESLHEERSEHNKTKEALASEKGTNILGISTKNETLPPSEGDKLTSETVGHKKPLSQARNPHSLFGQTDEDTSYLGIRFHPHWNLTNRM